MRILEKGYTFIELLISVTIISVLASGAVVAFNSFRERKVAQIDALSLAEKLRKVQVKAGIEYPVGCTGLNNYGVLLSGATMTVTVNCNSGTYPVSELTYTLPSSVFVNPATITFDSRTTTATPVTIDICGASYLYRISVSSSANVSQPSYQGGC